MVRRDCLEQLLKMPTNSQLDIPSINATPAKPLSHNIPCSQTKTHSKINTPTIKLTSLIVTQTHNLPSQTQDNPGIQNPQS